MSIVTFWNDSREQSGKTLTAVAVATNMSIERNSRILLISTSCNDSTIKNCFWGKETSKVTNLFGNKNNNFAVENGIEGLHKLITSNKLEPSVITDYTKVVLKDRLEIIDSFRSANEKMNMENIEQHKKIEDCYVELIKTANKYYDMIIVDLDKMLSQQIKESILKLSEVNVYVFSQRLSSITGYKERKDTDEIFLQNNYIPVIGKYDKRSKYNLKNITRFLEEKKDINLVPLNLSFMEATEESRVVDELLKFKNVKDKTDENYIFKECIQNLTESIWKKLQEMKMRLR